MFTTTKGSTIPYKTQTTIYSKLFFIAQWLKPPWWRWLPTSLPVVFGKPSRSLSTSSGFQGRKISPMVNESSWDFREVTAYVTCGKKLRIIQLKQQDRIRTGILGWEPPRDPKLNRLTCHDCIQGGATTKQNLLASKLTWWCCLCHHHIKIGCLGTYGKFAYQQRHKAPVVFPSPVWSLTNFFCLCLVLLIAWSSSILN